MNRVQFEPDEIFLYLKKDGDIFWSFVFWFPNGIKEKREKEKGESCRR